MKKVILMMAVLLTSVTLSAQQELTDEEKGYVQRLYQAQAGGNDDAFYQAEQDYMDYLQSKEDWGKYYNIWMNRALYNVNNKHFYRAYSDIHMMADDIMQSGRKEYLYISDMALGQYYVGRGNPKMGEHFLMKSLEQIDTVANPLATFNTYLLLAQSLSFTDQKKAMEYLDRLPAQMLENPMYKSGVLGFRCIIAHEMKDQEAFERYYQQYDSIRTNTPEGFNAANLLQVMVCRHLSQKDYAAALSWCDSIDVPLTKAELRQKVYEQMEDWQKAYAENLIRDSLEQEDANEVLEETLEQMSLDIDRYQLERSRSKERFIQLIIVGVMAAVIIALLTAIMIYRSKKNRKLKMQYQQLQETRKNLKQSRAIRSAFIDAVKQQLASPVRTLQGYARILNNPDFALPRDERAKRYEDVKEAAKKVESMISPVLNSISHDSVGITDEQKSICMTALKSPLQTLTGLAELVAADKDLQIPEEEYMQMRATVCQNAYQVGTAANELLLFCSFDYMMETPKKDVVGLNEIIRSTLDAYDLRNKSLKKVFQTDVSDDVTITTHHDTMYELLNCLFANADQYASGGSLEVGCYQDTDGGYSVIVTNEGEPIADEDAERIFEPFVRLAADSTNLGIGLTLARRMAQSMGYTLRLDTDYHEGIRFVIH